MINKSTYTIGAYLDGELVGFIRGFSDDHSVHFIQDIIVKESCKRQGIGGALLKNACEHYPKVRKTVLLSEKDAEPFYASQGFKPLEAYGGTCFVKITL
jgi:ribosomal protein S18 acetylase RimI-like enzyme